MDDSLIVRGGQAVSNLQPVFKHPPDGEHATTLSFQQLRDNKGPPVAGADIKNRQNVRMI